jgi:hypothetical protein
MQKLLAIRNENTRLIRLMAMRRAEMLLTQNNTKIDNLRYRLSSAVIFIKEIQPKSFFSSNRVYRTETHAGITADKNMHIVLPIRIRVSGLYSHVRSKAFSAMGLCILCPMTRWYIGTTFSLRKLTRVSLLPTLSFNVKRSVSIAGSRKIPASTPLYGLVGIAADVSVAGWRMRLTRN